MEVLPGQICCPDPNEDRVDVGEGDRCCDSLPYSSDGAQVCCGGKSPSDVTTTPVSVIIYLLRMISETLCLILHKVDCI